ncbi:MAG TPA: two-component regulator propeller domain-containing protein [Oleiagrimonas sp.]|nr:two-component regulator propeller domain-containing protein [Oleiagrimonas sp.]
MHRRGICAKTRRVRQLTGLFCLCLGFPLAAWAAQAPPQDGGVHVHVRHLGIEQGLAQSSGLAIAQGPRGYVWLGTESGLQRYDGYGFVYYHHSPGDPTSLSRDDVHAIAVAADGTVWVATGGGLDRLAPGHTGFTHDIYHADDPHGLSSNRLFALLVDRDGSLWVGGNNGVDRLLADGSFRHYRVSGKHPNPVAGNTLFQDRDGRVWVGTNAGLFRVDAASQSLQPFHPAGGSDAAAVRMLSHAAVYDLIRSRDGRLWVATDEGLFVLSTGGRIVAWLRHRENDPHSLSSNTVTSVLEDANGTIWAGTFGRGLNRLDPALRGWKAEHVEHDRTRPDGLANDKVMNLFEDATGLVWIGTYGGGFDIYNPRSSAFGAIRGHVDGERGLAGRLVRAIAGDGDWLWVGTDAGLTRFDKHSDEVAHYALDTPADDTVSGQQIRALHIGPDGTVWAGTRRNGLWRKPAGRDAFERVRLHTVDGNEHGQRHIRRIFRDRQERLWIATSWGLWRVDPATGDVLQRYLPTRGADALPAPEVTTICQTGDGALWVGSARGLRRFDGVHARFTVPRVARAKRGVLVHSDVLSCLPGRDDSLWVGTSDGLIHYWPRTGKAHKYDEAQGLPGMTVYAMLRDANGELWISTDRGLAQLDPGSGRIRDYGSADGLSNEEFNQQAAWASSDGTLYFGGIHGVTTVDPAHLVGDKARARVAITGYTLAGRGTRRATQAAPSPSLTVQYWQNIISFDLAVFDYVQPHDNRFRYRLDGFDTAWHTLDQRHSITYTNLGPGHYVLRVQGIDSNGRPTSNVATLALDVAAPPWLTAWAWLIYAVLTALLLTLGLYLFASMIGRRRDLASEQRRRHWAEAVQKLMQAISPFGDERAVASQLLRNLPDLIAHECSAFYAGNEDGMELVTTYGMDEDALDPLWQWGQTHARAITEWCRHGSVMGLNHTNLPALWLSIDCPFMAVSLGAIDDRHYFVLIGHIANEPLRQVDPEDVAVLVRQVKGVLDKADLIGKLQAMARTDSLTGASNRGWFMQQAGSEFQRCVRYRRPLSVLLIDVDHFKRVNDQRGHIAGDAVLAALVARCRDQLRTTDVLGRYGGEEFAVCLPETELAEALIIAERMRRHIGEADMATPSGPIGVTVSIGVGALDPDTDPHLETLIARVDRSLYMAKREGRNRVCGQADTAEENLENR